jgi:hypothetical protein
MLTYRPVRAGRGSITQQLGVADLGCVSVQAVGNLVVIPRQSTEHNFRRRACQLIEWQLRKGILLTFADC